MNLRKAREMEKAARRRERKAEIKRQGEFNAHVGKFRYEYEFSARREAERLRQTYALPSKYIFDAYLCPVCKGWHVGKRKVTWHPSK